MQGGQSGLRVSASSTAAYLERYQRKPTAQAIGTAAVDSLVWHIHTPRALWRRRGAAACARVQSGSWPHCGAWRRWGYRRLRRLAALALRDTAEGPYPRTFGGPGSCCTGWLLFCWRPWRERCTCCWSEGRPRCTWSPCRRTLPEGQQITGHHGTGTLVRR